MNILAPNPSLLVRGMNVGDVARERVPVKSHREESLFRSIGLPHLYQIDPREGNKGFKLKFTLDRFCCHVATIPQHFRLSTDFG